MQSKRKSSVTLTPSKFLPSIKTGRNRIGILRQSKEISPTMSMTPQPIIQLNTLVSNDNKESPLHVPNDDLNQISAKPTRNNEIQNDEAEKSDFQLKAPELISLKSSFLKDNVTQTSDTLNKPTNFDGKTEIPYWLRPTPVQPYPYNFIMAVRKKLESITNPVLVPQHQQQQSSTPIYENTPFAPRPKAVFSSKFRSTFDKQLDEIEKSLSDYDNQQSVEINEVAKEENAPKTVSPNGELVKAANDYVNVSEQIEYSMNFSSVSNNSKRISVNSRSKSLRKNIENSQDTLSISSGILSQSSPEKKFKKSTKDMQKNQISDEFRQPSPLTTDNVDGLQIASRSFGNTEQGSGNHEKSGVTSHINFSRGSDFSAFSQPSTNRTVDSINVHKFLRDFNESLSEVIKVNQHLHTVLSNPPSNSTVNTQRTSQNPSNKYSEDFEKIAGSKTSKFDSHISSNISESIVLPSYRSKSAEKSNAATSIGDNQVTSMAESIISDRAQNYSESMQQDTNEKSPDGYSNIVMYETDIKSSTRNYDNNNTTSIMTEIEKNQSDKSVTLIEEKLGESSESPTNNDLKSISLSIAKKSISTENDEAVPQSRESKSIHKEISGEPETLNQSIGSDILAIFNKTSLDVGDDLSSTTWIEKNVSYSNLGMVSG